MRCSNDEWWCAWWCVMTRCKCSDDIISACGLSLMIRHRHFSFIAAEIVILSHQGNIRDFVRCWNSIISRLDRFSTVFNVGFNMIHGNIFKITFKSYNTRCVFAVKSSIIPRSLMTWHALCISSTIKVFNRNFRSVSGTMRGFLEFSLLFLLKFHSQGF